MAHVIAILNSKGGCGKTTLATNLAKALELQGHAVMLVDADPQGSARDWKAANEAQELDVVGLDRPSIDRDIKAVLKGRDFIIIDGAPHVDAYQVAAAKCADLVLIPVQPSPYDIWATSSVVEIVKQRQEITDGKLKAAFIISRRIQGTKIGNEALDALAEYDLPILKTDTTQRVIYANAAAAGMAVMEMDAKSEAAKEIAAIAREVKEMIA